MPAEALEKASAAVEKALRTLLFKKRSLLVSIDGRSNAGKSTLAEMLSERLDCNIVHADDFFLQPCQRTAERYATPGGNIDYERLKTEVIDPWEKNGRFCYRPYKAHEDRFEPVRCFDQRDITIVEGSYSAHPALKNAYDLKVFLTTDPATQLERVKKRNGETAVRAFADRWIPLEELYFENCGTEADSDLCFKT